MADLLQGKGWGAELPFSLARSPSLVRFGSLSRREAHGRCYLTACMLVAGEMCALASCDVRDAAQVEWVVAGAVREFGRVDLLVNNAGYRIRGAAPASCSAASASLLDRIDRPVGLAGFQQGAQLGTGSRQHLGGGSQVDAAGTSVAGDQRPRADDAAARDPHPLPHHGVGADDAVGLDGALAQNHAMRPEEAVILDLGMVTHHASGLDDHV